MPTYEAMHVYWLTSNPADPAAPTMTEINAGTELTTYVMRDGFAPNDTTNSVDTGTLGTTFDGQVPGSTSTQVQLTMRKERGGATVAWDTLGTLGVSGCLVVCPNAAASAGQDAYVYPSCQTGEPALPTSAANEYQKFTTTLFHDAAPNKNAVVAA